MRLAYILFAAAATVTTLASGKVAAAASGRPSDNLAISSPDAVVSKKRFLRFYDDKIRGDESEPEERG
ncbi:RXLR domain-containing protein [Phytophthora infestans]|uniref:RxLR effector protein n=1 Tax=Phytophthora infestans TaxID=4787 RepID=A0A833SUQ0_PHYIN|nr:RXLR domain-containing protein [Phytophthora infestans]KAF4142053.1 RXLR effector domain-containing protein [Phytophthora infestans]